MSKPLPELLRPQTLDEVVGQQHLLGPDGVLRSMVNSGHLPSIIFWGPPGVGKTTLAYILSRHFNYKFVEFSGVDFSIKKLEELKPSGKGQSESQSSLFDAAPHSGKTVIFVDEIHRLNKSQQAQFLPYVERGDWILIGATTENPSFEVISPLLSRSQVLLLKPLTQKELKLILQKGIAALDAGLKIEQEVEEFLIQIANGDARLLLNAAEAGYRLFGKTAWEFERVKEAMGNLHLVYDKHGEEHYDTISALHKAMRGSDADASVYYLGRMLEAGEDPLYVARRCVRFAAEDIGNADPQSLILANAAFDSVNKIGMPESNVILAQLVIYLARAPKSNEAYAAYKLVQADIQQFGNLPIPLKLRNAPTQLMRELDYGKDYKYAHDFSPGQLEGEKYLPEELQDKKYTSGN